MTRLVQVAVAGDVTEAEQLQDLLSAAGIESALEPAVEHDPETLESNVPNLYLAGAILGGRQIGKIFIENGRHHAAAIASAIERKAKLVTA